MASYTNERDLYSFKKSNKLDINIYNVNYLGIPIEDMNVPYLFVLTENRIINSLFIPIKENTRLTKRYYKLILEKYYNIVL